MLTRVDCRPSAAAGNTPQFSSTTEIIAAQQNRAAQQNSLHARDADILDVFLAKGPDLVPTSVPTGTLGKWAAAAIPVQQVRGGIAVTPSHTHAPADKQTAMPPSICQATSLGITRPAGPHAGTALRLTRFELSCCWSVLHTAFQASSCHLLFQPSTSSAGG